MCPRITLILSFVMSLLSTEDNKYVHSQCLKIAQKSLIFYNIAKSLIELYMHQVKVFVLIIQDTFMLISNSVNTSWRPKAKF